MTAIDEPVETVGEAGRYRVPVRGVHGTQGAAGGQMAYWQESWAATEAQAVAKAVATANFRFRDFAPFRLEGEPEALQPAVGQTFRRRFVLHGTGGDPDVTVEIGVEEGEGVAWIALVGASASLPAGVPAGRVLVSNYEGAAVASVYTVRNDEDSDDPLHRLNLATGAPD